MQYRPVKERIGKPRVDKYIGGYTGHLPGAEAQMEKSFARIARGVETGEYVPKSMMAAAGSASAPLSMAAVYKPPGCREAIADYQLPGYTGYIPQGIFQCEKRYALWHR